MITPLDATEWAVYTLNTLIARLALDNKNSAAMIFTVSPLV